MSKLKEGTNKRVYGTPVKKATRSYETHPGIVANQDEFMHAPPKGKKADYSVKSGIKGKLSYR
jgi:hypothetical protein